MTEAFRLAPDDPSILADLGWGKLLEAADAEPDRRGASIEESLDLTRDALQVGGPKLIACFNYALAVLIRDGYEEAENEFRSALGVRPDSRSSIPARCGELYNNSAFRDVVKAGVLADLERVQGALDVATLDAVRQLVMSDGIPGRAITRSRLDGVQVDIWPKALSLSSTNDQVDLKALRAVWYHSPDGEGAWSVIQEPTRSTITRGSSAEGLHEVGALTRAGYYRVDLYRDDGRLVGFVEGAKPTPPAASVRVSVDHLGISLVIPQEWEELDPTDCRALGGSPNPWYGVEAWFGLPEGCSDFVALRRADGLRPDGLNAAADAHREVESWLQDQLTAWTTEEVSTILERPINLEGEWKDDPYFLSLDPAVVIESVPGEHWAAAGFSSYTTSPTCPGVAFMGVVVTSDEDAKQTIIDSLYPKFWPPPKVPPPDTSGFGFGLHRPDGWDAVTSKATGKVADALVAQDCTTGANVRVSLYELPSDSFVEDNMQSLSELEGFEEITRFTSETANGVPMEVIEFTWVSEDEYVHQIQTYTFSDDTGYILTFTIGSDDVHDYEPIVKGVLDSFSVTGLAGDSSGNA